ncbi:uncharacterized protein [Nicotiana tomentosiformis]|uniref:uncharacterized protein n=1 Tax=Nicotiana tomentosiformis TaxID=4098 RepID=UPI00388C8A06
MSSYFARYLDIHRGSVDIPVHVSAPFGDFIVVDHVYRSCVVTIEGYETRIALLLLIMFDFEEILGMDWLSLYHAILDCHAKTMTLAMRGCRVPVVREFSDVFHVDLPGMPPDRDIDFGIYLVSGIQPIFIPPYRMAPSKWKELNEQLQELLDKGFIRPSVSP